MELLTIILTSLFSLALLFVLCKLMGNKQISQLSMFDYIIGISIGSIAAELATELEAPLQPAIAMVVYALIAFGISMLTSRSVRARKIFVGHPILLMDNGLIYRGNMRQARMNLSDFLRLARIQGYHNIADVQTAILEENGTVSFLPKAEARPVQPRDLQNYPKQDTVMTNVILDGVVLERTLKGLGHNVNWLKNELKTLGFQNPREVYLAVCSEDGKLTAYPMKDEKQAFSPFD
ncbi:MAG: DUF421 domain-containing protein [Clostridia bacterium]|nr:DUF421 domain-containing protein [Clostridia bacterium]